MEDSSETSQDNNTARPTEAPMDHRLNGYNPLLGAICILAFRRNDSYHHIRQQGAVVITCRDVG
jgi:hypothetical protein